MENKKCVKCGYSTELSALQSESNAETFAVLKIEFPNADIIKTAFGSNQIYTKFKANLDKLINGYAITLGVRRQIIKNNIYLLRFNKSYTLATSASSAIQAAIELANLITRMNVKLLDRKNVALKCNFTIMKRDSDKNPYDIDTGFRANLLNQDDSLSVKALDSCQIITDEDFYEYYKDNYKLDNLDNILVKDEMKRFYQVDIENHINLNEYLEEIKKDEDDEDVIEVPDFIRDGIKAQDVIAQRTLEEANIIADEQLYNIDLINFDEINCAFYSTENVKVIDNIVEILQKIPRGIIGIKGSEKYQPYSLRLLAAADEIGIYQNVLQITCHNDMKYSPYAFFRELLLTVFDYTVSQKLFSQNDFSIFDGLDTDNLIKDLACLRKRDMKNLDDTRSEYFSVFLALLKSLPDTLIYIENFEKIDEGSKYVLSLLFDRFNEMNISYIISYDKDYSLHKDSHFLLSRPYYTEITLIPSSFSSIIAANPDFYKNIESDFYFKRIAKYAAGSTLFLDYAIQFLIESEVYRIKDNALEMINPKTTVIPATLSQLIKRRLNLLKDNTDLIKFLAMCVFIGPRIDSKTYDSFDIPNKDEITQDLADKGHLYIYNDCIYFPNYNLLRENLFDIIDIENFSMLAQEMFDTVFEENMPSPAKIFLYEKLEDGDNIIFEWEKLANLDLSMGDFASYLNCSGEIIKNLDKYGKNRSKNEIQKYKTSVYSNIANNMFEYNPDLTREIADKTLNDLQHGENTKNFTDLCMKMIQGAMDHGEYIYALNLTHKILGVMDKVSIDPSAANFDMKFLLMSIIHIKILFGIGAYNDCIDIGYNVLNALDSSKLEQIQYSMITKENLVDMLVESIAYIAISDVIALREDVGEFLDTVRKLYNFVPKEYDIFKELQKLVRGQNAQAPENLRGDNVFSNICYHIIRAFTVCKNDTHGFAREVYKAKIIAKDAYIFNLELFTDTLIGYSYTRLESYMKASYILYQVVRTSQSKGMNSVTFAAWYVMSILNFMQKKYDIAYGILNNSSIQLEKTGNLSEFLSLLNKVGMYKLMNASGEHEKAQICLSQAKYIIDKYKLNFDI